MHVLNRQTGCVTSVDHFDSYTYGFENYPQTCEISGKVIVNGCTNEVKNFILNICMFCHIFFDILCNFTLKQVVVSLGTAAEGVCYQCPQIFRC